MRIHPDINFVGQPYVKRASDGSVRHLPNYIRGAVSSFINNSGRTARVYAKDTYTGSHVCVGREGGTIADLRSYGMNDTTHSLKNNDTPCAPEPTPLRLGRDGALSRPGARGCASGGADPGRYAAASTPTHTHQGTDPATTGVTQKGTSTPVRPVSSHKSDRTGPGTGCVRRSWGGLLNRSLMRYGLTCSA